MTDLYDDGNAAAEKILADMRKRMEENPHSSMADYWATRDLSDYLRAVRDVPIAGGPTLDGNGHFTADPQELYLMGLPVDNPDRPTLRERVRVPDKSLAKRARKFLTLGAVYSARETSDKKRHERIKWEDWLKSFLSPADVKRMVELHKQGKV